MTLEFSIQKHTDKNKFIVNDNTEWVNRTNYMLVLLSHRYDKTAYKLVANTPNLPPIAANSWQVEAKIDGSYFLLLIAAPEWQNIAYVKNSLVYQNDKIYLAKKEVNAGIVVEDVEYWLEVNDTNCLPLLSTFPNAFVARKYYLHDEHAVICLGEKTIAYAGEKCGCTDDQEMFKDWMWTMMFYHASVYSHGFGEFEEAGKFMDNVNSRCFVNETKTPCGC